MTTGAGLLPLLFLDVDGPLIPFGGPAGRYPVFPQSEDPSNPLLGRLDPAHGRRLAALPCEPVWATTWGPDANAHLAPLLGLPELRELPQRAEGDEAAADAWAGLSPKTRGIVAFAAGRDFVWVDDEIGGPDRTWVARHHQGRALLWWVDPAVGLTDGDYAAVGAWLHERAGG
ncbi:hypothetical protein ACWC5I_42215 [Kitasatospora sp. NPDC001574]